MSLITEPTAITNQTHSLMFNVRVFKKLYCSVLVLFLDWSLGGSECEKTKRIYSHLRKWTCMLQNQCCFMSVCVCVLFCQNTCCDRVINPKLWPETARLDAVKHTCTGAGRWLFLVFLTQAGVSDVTDGGVNWTCYANGCASACVFWTNNQTFRQQKWPKAPFGFPQWEMFWSHLDWSHTLLFFFKINNNWCNWPFTYQTF